MPRPSHRTSTPPSPRLEDLPNVGPSVAADLRAIGVEAPDDLRGRDGYEMYDALCRVTGRRHDPCVVDVFLALTDFVRTGRETPWWAFTAERKAHLSASSPAGAPPPRDRVSARSAARS